MDENTEKVISSIEALPEQCEQAWQESRGIDFPPQYRDCWNVTVCGMGGSGLPGHIVKSVFASNVPIELVNSYDLPAWVGDKTLVFLSSYSGNTEEVLSCAEQAKERTRLITGIATGGQLEKFFAENNFPAYIFEPKHNLSQQPRFGLGYGTFGQLGIFSSLGVVSETVGGEALDEAVKQGINYLRQSEQYVNDRAEELLGKLEKQGLMVFAADHLVGNAHVFANQANETAKTFAAWFALPEVNHHLLEGFKHPKEELVGIFLESDNYSVRMKRRFELTRQIVEKNGYKTFVYKPQKGTLIQEALEVLFLSSAVTLQLAMSYNEDPTAIPWVDFFKRELEKEG